MSKTLSDEEVLMIRTMEKCATIAADIARESASNPDQIRDWAAFICVANRIRYQALQYIIGAPNDTPTQPE